MDKYGKCPECKGLGYHKTGGEIDYHKSCKTCRGWTRQRGGASFGEILISSKDEPCTACSETGHSSREVREWAYLDTRLGRRRWLAVEHTYVKLLGSVDAEWRSRL